MRRRSAQHLNLGMVVLMIVASCTGLVHGLWSETLQIGGTVTTGEMTAVWFYRSCDVTGGGKVKGKDIATWQVRPVDNQWSQDQLIVQVTNAYPGFSLYCEAHIANTGSMPVKVKTINIVNSNPTGVSVTAQEDPTEIGKTLYPCQFSPDWPDSSKNDKGFPITDVPAQCRQEIQFTVRATPQLAQGTWIVVGFSVTFEQAL